jgi:hypothetical protein
MIRSSTLGPQMSGMSPVPVARGITQATRPFIPSGPTEWRASVSVEERVALRKKLRDVSRKIYMMK